MLYSIKWWVTPATVFTVHVHTPPSNLHKREKMHDLKSKSVLVKRICGYIHGAYNYIICTIYYSHRIYIHARSSHNCRTLLNSNMYTYHIIAFHSIKLWAKLEFDLNPEELQSAKAVCYREVSTIRGVWYNKRFQCISLHRQWYTVQYSLCNISFGLLVLISAE
jgi:hypothetical protein